LVAPPVVDFGNGTRAVFKRWSDGVTQTSREVVVNVPVQLYAVYELQYNVTFTTYNWTKSMWLPAGTKLQPPTPPPILYDDGQKRVIFVEWIGVPERATGPTVVEARTTTYYHVTLKYPWTAEKRWLPEGWTLEMPPERYQVLWIFDGWSPSNAVYGPGVYEAVYVLDYVLVIAVVGSVVGAVALTLYWRRRRQ